MSTHTSYTCLNIQIQIHTQINIGSCIPFFFSKISPAKEVYIYKYLKNLSVY